MKIGAQHEVLNVFSILDLLGAAPSGASLVGVLFENPCKKTSVNTRRMMPEMVFVVVLKCVSGIVHQCEALKRAGLGGKNSRAPIVESL